MHSIHMITPDWWGDHVGGYKEFLKGDLTSLWHHNSVVVCDASVFFLWFIIFNVCLSLILNQWSVYLRSSVGPNFARTRATIFAVIGFIFLAAGVGVTVGTLDLARDSGGKPQVHIYTTSFLSVWLYFCQLS